MKRAVLFGMLTVVAMGGAQAQSNASDPFGRQENTASGLIGILYDFKQNQKRQPTGLRPDDYTRVLGEFLRKGWSEDVLNRYFRATRPLYTTQIFIPEMNADQAPRAFGVEKIIRPASWIVYYKGQVSAPEDGAYRFLAYADDVIAVAVDGRVVCLAGRPDTAARLKVWNLPEQGPEIPAANGKLVYGDWMELKKDQPIDLDVIVGERPGGLFSAFLLYQKRGESYPVDASGRPLYPVFQLAPLPAVSAPRDKAPAHGVSTRPWTSWQ